MAATEQTGRKGDSKEPRSAGRLIEQTIDEINQHLPPLHQASKSPDLIIRCLGSPYDSLHLIGFFVALEDRISRTFGVNLSLLKDDYILGRVETSLTARELALHLEAHLAADAPGRPAATP